VRLIENLSRGMDAGSFNIVPSQPAQPTTTTTGTRDYRAASTTSSEHYTVEERMDRILASMANQ
jgi:serine/arginine repetitive matrix protein 2